MGWSHQRLSQLAAREERRKSDLLHINSNKTKLTPTPQILFNNQPIYPCKPEETIRYLGIYYDGQGSTKPTLELITNKIQQFCKLIKFKKLLPKQITLLFNSILALSLEYLLQIIPLTKQISKKLSSTITKHIKQLLNLSLNTNNNILTNPQLLNSPTLEKLFLNTSSSN